MMDEPKWRARTTAETQEANRTASEGIKERALVLGGERPALFPSTFPFSPMPAMHKRGK